VSERRKEKKKKGKKGKKEEKSGRKTRVERAAHLTLSISFTLHDVMSCIS
jgi:hypothetical protein